jgi:hypothetical protein
VGRRLLDRAKSARGGRIKVEPRDLSGDLVVRLGTVAENLKPKLDEKSTGHAVIEVKRRVFHNVHRWMAATLDGRIETTGAVFEAKFMLPCNFNEEAPHNI